MSIPDEIPTDYNVYCDESSVSKQRYMAIGGIWVPKATEKAVRSALAKVRTDLNLNNELKWTRISGLYLDRYLAFASVFFQFPDLQFNCIVVDRLLVDHRKYNKGAQELGFYKFYFRVLDQNIEVYNQYWIYTDRKSNRDPYRLSDLNRILNHRKGARPGQPPVRHLQPLDSKKDDLLQLTDLLLGAVQSHYNGGTTSAARIDFATYIAKSAGFVTLKIATSRKHRLIRIWRWKPRQDAGI